MCHNIALTYYFPNLESVHCSVISSNCCFLTCIQISQEAGQVVWYFHHLKNFPQFVVIHTIKGFGIFNKVEVDDGQGSLACCKSWGHRELDTTEWLNWTELNWPDMLSRNSCFFDDLADVGNLISGSSAFSKSSLNIWNFMVYILLKHGLENFEHYFASVWDECNCVVVWTFFCIAFSISWMSWKSYIENLLWDFLVYFCSPVRWV